MRDTIHIYCPENSPRLHYTFEFAFAERLGLEYKFHSDKNEFLEVSGYRLNYSKDEISGSICVIPTGLLSSIGFAHEIPAIKMHDGFPLIYPNETESIKHDIFSAIFYCLSRMEEYVDQTRDQHGRFLSNQSLFQSWGCLQVPIVDYYLYRLRKFLTSQYPAISLSKVEYQIELTIDVDRVFQFKSNSWIRTLLGSFKNMVSGSSNAVDRIRVKFGSKPDLIDVYEYIINAALNRNLRPIFFVQVGGSSGFDINDEIVIGVVKDRILLMAQKSEIGVHPSYRSSENSAILSNELTKIVQLSGIPISKSRQHYLRMKWPDTLKQLEELGITDEYSMGYSDLNGFRAGTSAPFLWFDLPNERISNIRLHPMIFMDMVSVKAYNDDKESCKELEELFAQVKKYGGTFSTTFHPDALKGIHVPRSTQNLFDKLMTWANSSY